MLNNSQQYKCWGMRSSGKTLQVYKQEIDRLNNIINEVADDILKELNENHHLSYGVALAIRQKLISYREINNDKKKI